MPTMLFYLFALYGCGVQMYFHVGCELRLMYLGLNFLRVNHLALLPSHTLKAGIINGTGHGHDRMSIVLVTKDSFVYDRSHC